MTLPWQFRQLSADDQREFVRRMSTDGMGDRSIGEITGLSAEMVRHLIDPTPRGRYEDFEAAKRLDESCSVSSPFSGEAIPKLPGDFD
jgi:hypothetical protein